ncbi:hypothetical protein [Dyella sp. 2HG41-7]|uniref:hypothetical protein n=1 Tax=Dyella sp. 2HG41-7 TaxID=2883239 RepID=UPI001F1A81EF|nr:hypothetical protein [Dyella sp. 2HG41-7]
MKISHPTRIVVALAMGMTSYQYSPLALSSEGGIFNVGQTVYAKRATIACNSKEELQRAQDIAKNGDKGSFFAYLNGHCGAFDKVEAMKVLKVEAGADDPIVVVTDLDDPSAPAKLWMVSSSLSFNR